MAQHQGRVPVRRGGRALLAFDYAAAVQAGIDHDRFGDLLRLLDWEIARTQRTVGRSLLGPLTAMAEALQRVARAIPSHHD